jgi:uncharacterized RDD family membrane protein YckC
MTDNNLNLAGQGQRILIFIIDMTAIIILWFALIVGLKLLGVSLTSVDETGEQVSRTPYILLLLIFWCYYLLTEYLSQRTLGKFLTKTKVVSIDGARATLKQLIFRTLSRSIPFEYFSYLVTVEGIHDKLSKTRVIKI